MKISDYLEKLTSKGKFKNKDLVESISEIHRAALEALWTDDPDALPAREQNAAWWEIWLRAGDDPQRTVDFFTRMDATETHPAEWTDAMRGRFKLNNQTDWENLIRCCGYGVPDLERALWSAQNDTTLIAQDDLQPFDKENSRYVTRDLNLHAIPWPRDILQQWGETPVEMRVTLSYFVEPNPARRGWGRKYSYASHGFRFDVKRAEESLDDFRASINRLASDEEKGRKSSRPGDKNWDLGANLRKLGSVHSDTWRGTAADLAERGYIAVFPVIGWWRENPRQGRWNKKARYSLVITIRTPETRIKLYNAVKNVIRQSVGISIS